MTASNTLVFAGDVQGYVDRWMGKLGWVREYRALGLANRANYIPVTDSETDTDTSIWNLPGDDPNFIASRAGRTVGQIVTSVLTMQANALALYNAGIGQWASTSPWILPAQTVSDLNALTVIPPFRVSISGERILLVLENFIQSCHPKIWLHVMPNGLIRFFDTTAFAANTLTLGSDARLGMPQLTRDFSDCYSQVLVRGNTLTQGVTLQVNPWSSSSLPDGGIQYVPYGGYTIAASKTHWTMSCWNQPLQNGQAYDTGSCTVIDTTHISVTSSNSSESWVADFWDQSATGVLGNVMVQGDLYAGSAIQQLQRRVIANTALSPGGSSVLTLDQPLNGVNYNSYQLWGLTLGCNRFGREFVLTNSLYGQSMQPFFPWPFPFVGAFGNSATMTTTPICQVIYGNQIAIVGITIDPVNGVIYTDRPVQTIFGSPQYPDDVQVFLPIANGTLEAWAPSSSTYSGTLYTVEGIQRTKILTVLDWKDYSNQSDMQTFAQEYLTSVQDVVVEGSLPYYGLNTTFLLPGEAVSIAGTTGTSYTTGWENLKLPVVGVDVGWNNANQGTSYTMNLHLSNRRGRYSAEAFLRPNITHAQLTGSSIGAQGIQMGGLAAVSGETMYDEQANYATAGMMNGEMPQQRPYQPGGPRDWAGNRREVLPLMRRMQERREQRQRQRLGQTMTGPRQERELSLALLGTRRDAERRANREKPEGIAEQDPRLEDTARDERKSQRRDDLTMED